MASLSEGDIDVSAFYRWTWFVCSLVCCALCDPADDDGAEMIEAAVIAVLLAIGSLVLILFYEFWK